MNSELCILICFLFTKQMVRPKVYNEVTHYCQNNDGSLLIINSLEPSFIKEEIEMDEYDDDIITNIIETKPFVPIPSKEKLLFLSTTLQPLNMMNYSTIKRL